MPDNDGELTPGDVESYTKGRLPAADDETARLLTAALGAARRYCGWHVTPVLTDPAVKLDGPGSPLLVLPTLRLSALTSVTENGFALDLSALTWSTRGLVRKKSGARWSDKFGAIEVGITHGFEAAPDWQAAVLSMVDRISTGGGETVGPFKFPDVGKVAPGSTFSAAEKAILDLYALEKSP